jgi:CRP-like cAMP-binding protein
LRQLSLRIKEKRLCRDTLFEEGEILESLFILKKGKVESFLNKKNLIERDE